MGADVRVDMMMMFKFVDVSLYHATVCQWAEISL
jgi:hypothetical protein